MRKIISKNNIRKNSKGITLVALVITIIILLILAGITINSLTNSEILEKGNKAIDEFEISNYKEQIELVKMELQMKNEIHKLPLIYELQVELDKKEWVNSTDIVIDKEIEKMKLITKDGYIFYITDNNTEYKGRVKQDGVEEIFDTSALQKNGVLEMNITETTQKGKFVKIVDISGKNYYKIKYRIGINNSEWKEIESGDTVEVPYDEIIYAKLVYGSDSGIEHELAIKYADPIVISKELEGNEIKRKDDISFASLFKITWGSDGTGTSEYSIEGNLDFNGTTFSSNEIESLSELEIGTYKVKCEVTSPLGKKATAQKDIQIKTLASTTVEDNNNQKLDSYAIYSEYDLAYFRDLVNKEKLSTINAKVMNNINLSNVCLLETENWIPIGYIKNDISFTDSVPEYLSYYSGIFDGNLNSISNLKIENSESTISLGLFGAVKDGIIKNCILDNENIIGNRIVGSIVGYMNNTSVSNCKSSGTLQGYYGVGGIIGFMENQCKVYSCKNETDIVITGGNNFGGIVGGAKNDITIKYCYNVGTITSETSNMNVGGILGRLENKGEISYSYNSGNIYGSFKPTGGILGVSNTNTTEAVNIINCYNIANVRGSQDNDSGVGGIVGKIESDSTARSYIENVYNKGNISHGYSVGGISGILRYTTLKGEILNYGNVTEATNEIGAICGYNGSTVELDFTKRAYGGNCPSSLKTNGSGNNNSYDSNLVMPSVYSIVNATNTNEFIIEEGTDVDHPKLKNLIKKI